MSSVDRRLVIVVDDDPDIGHEVRDALELRKFPTVYAADYAAALAALQREDAPCIVVVDYHMPAMNGIEVIQHLKGQASHPLAFIMLTGDGGQDTAIQAVRAHVFDFINKPVTGLEISNAVLRASEQLERLVEEEGHLRKLEFEANELRGQVEAVSEMLERRGEMLRSLLTSGAAARQLIDKWAPDGEELECVPVDVSALLRRMIPALESVGAESKIRVRGRLGVQLPFLFADEARLIRAFRAIAKGIVSELPPDSTLTIMTMRDGDNIIITFRVRSSGVRYVANKILVHDLGTIIKEIEGLSQTSMKFLTARIVVQLHGGRIQIVEAGQESAVRIYFPLPASTKQADAPIAMAG